MLNVPYLSWGRSWTNTCIVYARPWRKQMHYYDRIRELEQ